MTERPDFDRTLRNLRVGATRTMWRSRGHGSLSSVSALKEVMAKVAEGTGNKDYLNLVEDALRAEHARGVKGTAELLSGYSSQDTNDLSVIQAEGGVVGEEPGYGERAIELARRSRVYKELAETPLRIISDRPAVKTKDEYTPSRDERIY